MTFSVRHGRCLCGAVRFQASVATAMQACHCTQCQRWTGGGPLYVARVRNLDLKGEEKIKTYHASEWGERANCEVCGAALYWRMRGKPVGFVAVGLLDDQSGMTVTEEIFVDNRPDWMPPIAGASQSTEAQELAKLEAFLEGDQT